METYFKRNCTKIDAANAIPLAHHIFLWFFPSGRIALINPIRNAMAPTVAKLKVNSVAIVAFAVTSERFTLIRLKMPTKMPIMDSTSP